MEVIVYILGSRWNLGISNFDSLMWVKIVLLSLCVAVFCLQNKRREWNKTEHYCLDFEQDSGWKISYLLSIIDTVSLVQSCLHMW
jgi:hypothetical protein